MLYALCCGLGAGRCVLCALCMLLVCWVILIVCLLITSMPPPSTLLSPLALLQAQALLFLTTATSSSRDNPEHGLRLILTFKPNTSFLVPLDKCVALAKGGLFGRDAATGGCGVCCLSLTKLHPKGSHSPAPAHCKNCCQQNASAPL